MLAIAACGDDVSKDIAPDGSVAFPDREAAQSHDAFVPIADTSVSPSGQPLDAAPATPWDFMDASPWDGSLDAGVATSSVNDAGHDAAEDASPALCTLPEPVRVVDVGALNCLYEQVTAQYGSPERTLAETDETYAGMKPVDYDPPSGRWQYLKRTREILCCQGRLEVVMLGDSIIADTGRSRWDDYLEQATGATVIKLVAVRNGTGPLWYQHEPRVFCSAVRYKPDLIILGGISEIDPEASRSMIRQIRRDSESEILLLTPAFGYRDPADLATWSYEVDATKDAQRAQLVALAAEEKVGLLDMTAEWGRYVRESSLGVEAFKRDVVHANPQGEQLEGRILLQHLTPALGGTACDSSVGADL